MSSATSTADAINGYVPTINATGSGTVGSPWAFVLDEDWANEVAALPTDIAALSSSIPDGIWQAAGTTVTQSVSVTASGYDAYVFLAPYTVAWVFKLTVSSSGTGNNVVSLSCPVSAANTAQVGAGMIRDSNTSQNYAGMWEATNVDYITFYPGGSTYGQWGTNPNLALASGDVLYGSIVYEAASVS